MATRALGCKCGDIAPTDKYGGPSQRQPVKDGGPPPQGTRSAASVSTPVPRWRVIASASRTNPGESLEDIATRVAAMPAAASATLERTFDAMAASPPTPAGVALASKLAHDTRAPVDPRRAGPGGAPGVALLHVGAMAVLKGLIALSCAEAARDGNTKTNALELMKALRRMPLPRVDDAAGWTDGGRDRRELEDELKKNLDDATWREVYEGAAAWPPVADTE